MKPHKLDRTGQCNETDNQPSLWDSTDRQKQEEQREITKRASLDIAN